MTTPVGRHGSPWRLTPLFAILVVAAGCSGSASPDTASPSSTVSAAANSTTIAVVDQATTSTIPEAESLALDLAAIPDAYEFTSTTSVGQTEALRIVGRIVNGDTELAISSTDASR